MMILKRTLIGLLTATAVSAIDISVRSEGGNSTGGFRYGLLHEVRNEISVRQVIQV